MIPLQFEIAQSAPAGLQTCSIPLAIASGAPQFCTAPVDPSLRHSYGEHMVSESLRENESGVQRSDRKVGAMRHHTRLGVIGIAAICASLALSGCSTPAASYTLLDQPASSADEPPADLPDYAFDNSDRESARMAGVHGDTSLWLLRGTDEGVCLLSYAGLEAWSLACSGGSELSSFGEAGHFRVLPDGAPGPEGATQISENVYALG